MIRVNPRYAYDVTYSSRLPHRAIGLSNKRVFAFADCGVPDGSKSWSVDTRSEPVKCDRKGNVYSGCGDGLHIWSKSYSAMELNRR